MAALTEGSYIIMPVHALSKNMAMDVDRALSGNSVNIRQFNRNDTDAQIWVCVKMGSYWQIFCSLTGKCVDIANNSMAEGTNIRQYQDNNSDAQRWSIVDLGTTVSYGGTTYTKYRINAKSNSNKVIDVNGNVSTPGANIFLHSWNGGNNQQWIFVPKPTLTETGAYRLVSATDASKVIATVSDATGNGAKFSLQSKNESKLSQAFLLSSNAENYLTTIRNANSSKLIFGELNKEVTQQTWDSKKAQNYQWLLVQFGSMTVDGSNTPTYQLRLQAGDLESHGMKVESATKLTVKKLDLSNGQLSGPANERFAFVKIDLPAGNMTAPGKLEPTVKTRDGAGDVSLSGLKFKSTYNKFQARYRTITYHDVEKTSSTTSNWMNLYDNSTARSGWGEAWTQTFNASPNSDGYVTLPFNKSFTLSAEDPFIDVEFQIRPFNPNYISGGYSGVGPITGTTVNIVQNPTVGITLAPVLIGDAGTPITKVVVGSSYPAQYVKARMYDSEGTPLSDWKSSADAGIEFDMVGDLKRLPNNGEEIKIEYVVVAGESTSLKGTVTKTFSYTDGVGITTTPLEGEGACIIASRTGLDSDLCFMQVDYIDGPRYIQCPSYSYQNSIKSWKVIPPLNKTTNLMVIGISDGTITSISFGECRVDSHLFMWNWNVPSSTEMYDKCAGLLINSENPPAQTRTFKTDISFQSPAGRSLPVAFSGKTVDAALNVEGVVVDEDAYYVAAGPIPECASMESLKQLISLSGKGIHPIYRSPYGDWATVGIENVDLSKTELNLSSVKVNQRAVED